MEGVQLQVWKLARGNRQTDRSTGGVTSEHLSTVSSVGWERVCLLPLKNDEFALGVTDKSHNDLDSIK